MVHALEGDNLFTCVGTRRLSIRACGVCDIGWAVGVITSLDSRGLHAGISQRECARGASETVGAGDGERVCTQIASQSRSISGVVVTTSGKNRASIWN